MTDHVVHDGRLYESQVVFGATVTAELFGRYEGGGELGVMTLDDDNRMAVEVDDVPSEVFGWWCDVVARRLGLDVAGLVPGARRGTDGRR